MWLCFVTAVLMSDDYWRQILLGRAGNCPPTICRQWGSHV